MKYATLSKRRTSPAQGLPIDHHGPALAGLEEEVVQPKVTMAGRARSRPALQVRGQMIDEELADGDVLGRQLVGVALQESRPE